MDEFERIKKSFESNASAVYELLGFDRFILDFVVGGLQKLADELAQQGRNTAANTVSNRVSALVGVRAADSLRPRYATIFNQCIVLLVSYFGAAVHSLFLEAVSKSLSGGAPIPAAEQELKIAWRELTSRDEPLHVVFGNLLVAQKDISFQDMQSITRAFKDYVGLELVRTEQTNDIIFGQAARHVIVHAGGIVDAKMVRQVAGAKPRRLKASLQSGQRVQFEPDDVRVLGDVMSSYITNLADRLSGLGAGSVGPSA